MYLEWWFINLLMILIKKHWILKSKIYYKWFQERISCINYLIWGKEWDWD